MSTGVGRNIGNGNVLFLIGFSSGRQVDEAFIKSSSLRASKSPLRGRSADPAWEIGTKVAVLLCFLYPMWKRKFVGGWGMIVIDGMESSC
jgi:hypothetical protein